MEDPFDIVYYVTPISIVRDRLELAGYTLANARRLFGGPRLKYGNRSRGSIEGLPELDTIRRAEIENLRELTPEKWLSYLRRIDADNLTYENRRDHEGTYIAKMLGSSLSDVGWYGYRGPDPLVGSD